jgi:glutathione S-transferase
MRRPPRIRSSVAQVARSFGAMKLYRFRYSPFARKVQAVLDLMGANYDCIEVSYGERDELARVTGGWVQVPVLVDDDGKAVVESRVICERLLDMPAGAHLVPPPLEGPIWAYADFVDGPLEDVLFRVASPWVRDAWKTPFERGMYVYVKERKFGVGCVDAWDRDRDSLIERAQKLLEPTLRTLAARPFLFGDRPTLADAALYGPCAMLEEAHPELLARVDARLVAFARRVEGEFPKRR